MNEVTTFLSRRDMVHKLVLGTGAIASSSLGFTNAFGGIIKDGYDKKLGVALVGLGNYSNLMLGPALQETKYCKLTSIVTGTPSKEEEWASR